MNEQKIQEQFKFNLIELIEKYRKDYPDNKIATSYQRFEKKDEVDSIIYNIEQVMSFFKDRD
jgi:hypothetical protein|tara:strand:+ start:511 stop:696 length:186 start_codon:yes stop_codon:yes gene_type:complete